MVFSPSRPATPRSISFKRTAAGLVLAALLAPNAAAAGGDDTAAMERGRSAGRTVLIFRDPRVCGIALLRERCISDVDAFLGSRGDGDFKAVPNVGPHPATGLRAFVTTGDRDGFDRSLAYLNSTSSTAAMWSADARSAALYDAGIEDVLMPAARGSEVEELLGAGSVMDLAQHVAEIPAQALPVDVGPIKPVSSSSAVAGAKQMPSGMMKFARDLVAAIDAAMPAPPLVAMRYSAGAAGDAALGVASSTVSELVDSPKWLAQSDAQRFVDDYCTRLASIAPGRKAQLKALRAALRGDASFAHDAALNANTEAVVALFQTDSARTKPILLGSMAAQMVYNAAILRDPGMGSMATRLLQNDPALDGAVPGWSAARAEMTGLGAQDWSGQYRAGVKLVGLIQKANAS
jgi:hypothetical protein